MAKRIAFSFSEEAETALELASRVTGRSRSSVVASALSRELAALLEQQETAQAIAAVRPLVAARGARRNGDGNEGEGAA